MRWQEGFVYFDAGKMDQILPKVLQFNTDLQKEGVSNKYLVKYVHTIVNLFFQLEFKCVEWSWGQIAS